MQRVADVTKQLDIAQKTINSLENVNVSAHADRYSKQMPHVFCFFCTN